MFLYQKLVLIPNFERYNILEKSVQGRCIIWYLTFYYTIQVGLVLWFEPYPKLTNVWKLFGKGDYNRELFTMF